MSNLNNFKPFHTIAGYKLLDELKNFVSSKTCIVTMEDLWEIFKSNLNTNVDVYFVKSLEEIKLEEEISKFEKYDTIVGLGGGQALDIAKYFSWKCNLKLFQFPTSLSVDAVFGHRFARGGNVVDYPTIKLLLNRLTNWIICLLFAIRYSDVTNAFKLYRRSTLLGLEPLLSHHFNLTVELPLKVIVRGFSYSVIPNSWYNRKTGVSKLKIKEMGSRYWFIILYCLVEKWLSVGDFRKDI